MILVAGSLKISSEKSISVATPYSKPTNIKSVFDCFGAPTCTHKTANSKELSAYAENTMSAEGEKKLILGLFAAASPFFEDDFHSSNHGLDNTMYSISFATEAVSFEAKFQRAWQSACFLRARSHCISTPTHAASAPGTWKKAVWVVMTMWCDSLQENLGQKILLRAQRKSYEQQCCGLTFELPP